MKIFNPANLITLIRLILGIPAIYFLLNNQTTISIIFYLIILALDFLDGFVARKLKCETIFGKNFDFITDGVVGGSIVLVLLIQNKVPLTYVYLFIPPLIMLTIAILWGIKISKNTFIPSKWRKLNGATLFLTVLLFMINKEPAIILAYIILVYIYISRIKHLLEIYRLAKS
ncbi:MAG TPA: CDP-alcohol phosphatidyltransferase family protein [Candidatus Nanoarchaeia archaeon]|nr:CDP-alcohol phosphatidyltransferase family protein [Candidatus Nanoarchaeia archaeon]